MEEDKGEEWFWRDRLAVPVEHLGLPPCPASVEADLLKRLEVLHGQPLTSAGEASDYLSTRGEAALGPLSQFLDSPDRTVCWAAVTATGRIKSRHTIPLMLKVLNNGWDAPAIYATCALERQNEPWIIPRLIKTLGPYPVDFNPHLMVRIKAAGILIGLGNFSPVPFLIKVLKEDTPEEDKKREWDHDPRMAWAKEESLKILKSLTGNDFAFHVDASLPDQATSALAFERWWMDNRSSLWKEAPPLDDPGLERKILALVKGLSAFQARNADGARYCLKMLGPPAFPYLAEAIRSGGFYEKFHSLDILSQLAPLSADQAPAWAEVATGALSDESPAVRMQAARSLGFLKYEPSLSFLKGVVSDPDPDVVIAAIDSMGRIGGETAAGYLNELLQNENPGMMVVEIKAALVRISSQNDALLVEELNHSDSRRRTWASQKILDLFGEDFGFLADAPPPDRKESIDKIRNRLAQWHR